MKVEGQNVQIADLDRDRLPYEDGQFDLVTCVEVIEHVENFRAVVREVFRILRPGGVAVFTTPNVLNMRSRLRYLSSGFYNLFGPVLLDRPDVRPGARGHISPINFFYLAHAFASAGFRDLTVSVDKYQRRSILGIRASLAADAVGECDRLSSGQETLQYNRPGQRLDGVRDEFARSPAGPHSCALGHQASMNTQQPNWEVLPPEQPPKRAQFRRSTL